MFAALGVIVLALTSTFSAAQKAAEDLPAGAMQAKATTSCLECHEARIILQQRLSKAAWTKEVDKMIKWGAVVDASDHDALIDYLSTNFGPTSLRMNRRGAQLGRHRGRRKNRSSGSKAPPTQCPEGLMDATAALPNQSPN